MLPVNAEYSYIATKRNNVLFLTHCAMHVVYGDSSCLLVYHLEMMVWEEIAPGVDLQVSVAGCFV